MTRIRSDRRPDSTIAFLADPYRFISRRARRFATDVFATRLLGRRTICMLGREAARLFHDPTRMQREGALPRRLVRTLVGQDSVQTLDGEAHRARKALLLELTGGQHLYRLHAITAAQWRHHAQRWQKDGGGVCLYRGSAALLACSAFEWVGLQPQDPAVARRLDDVIAMFDGAGAVGPRHWRALAARRRTEAWLAGRVEDLRRDMHDVEPHSPLARLVRYRDAQGQALPARVAAVELLNLLRPVAAISVYVTFAAHALHRHPAERERLAAADPRALANFTEEVRRFYPFFPATAARTTGAFEWQGLDFPAHTRVLLDLYGTNHDPRIWTQPERFDPDRFAAGYDELYGLIPQGAGSHADGHRCAGETITRALLRQASAFLAGQLEWTVDGDPQVDFARLPALPRGGMMLRQVRLRP
jgi:fatty-acid peroxygenase